MEIVLSSKQRKVIEDAFREQQQLQVEYQKIQRRIDDAVLLVLDTKGIEVVQGIQYNDGKLTVPEEKAQAEQEPEAEVDATISPELLVPEETNHKE